MTTGFCLLAAALLFFNSMRMAGVLEAHFGIPGGLVSSAPDPGFWWVGALLVVVALANLAAPVPELVRQALAPIEDPFEPAAAEATPAPDA
jgi:hypothetical protein